jgi:hypothetical protein
VKLPKFGLVVYSGGWIGSMANSRAVLVKTRAVLRAAGHSDGEHGREYKDWHIEIHGGLSYLSIWTSAGMVFLSLSDIVVFHRPGPWEQYLDLLFQKRAP